MEGSLQTILFLKNHTYTLKWFQGCENKLLYLGFSYLIEYIKRQWNSNDIRLKTLNGNLIYLSDIIIQLPLKLSIELLDSTEECWNPKNELILGYTTAIFSINKSLEFYLNLKKKENIFNNQLVKYKYTFDRKLHKRIHSCVILQSPIKNIEKNEILADNISSLQIAQTTFKEYEELEKNLFIFKLNSEQKEEVNQCIDPELNIERKRSVSYSDQSSDKKSGINTPKFSIDSEISHKSKKKEDEKSMTKSLKTEKNEALIKRYTLDEVQIHNKINDGWVIFDDKVYDVTPFIRKHPGGQDHIINYLGKNITEISRQQHSYINPHGIIHKHLVGLYKKN